MQGALGHSGIAITSDVYVHLDGKTVAEVLEQFKARFPEAGSRFFSSESKASRFVNLYLNDEDIRFLKDLQTPVGDNDTLSIILAIAGGAPCAPMHR